MFVMIMMMVTMTTTMTMKTRRVIKMTAMVVMETTMKGDDDE